jgi:hypothetical protein
MPNLTAVPRKRRRWKSFGGRQQGSDGPDRLPWSMKGAIVFGRRQPEEHVGPLAEFTALRAEILHLVELQWKSVTVLITTTGAVFGFALSSATRIPLLLIIPFSSYVLCTRWIINQGLIDRAARYIRTELDPKVPGGLGYEQWIKRLEGPYVGIRKIVRLAGTSPTVLMHPGLAVLTLATVATWFLTTPTISRTAPLAIAGIVGWSVGVLLTLLSLRLMWRAQRAREDDRRQGASKVTRTGIE